MKLLQLLGILDEQEPSVQPREKVSSWGNIYSANIKSGYYTASISENK